MINKTIELLTERRIELDAMQKAIQLLPPSRVTALAITAIQKGRMYLGEVNFVLGKEFPYEKTKKATTPEGIQPAVDLSDAIWKLRDNEIISLNEIRTELDSITEETTKAMLVCATADSPKDIYTKFILDCNISEAYRSLKEGRMWLGVRLGEIRDNNLPQSNNNGKGK